LCPIAFWYLVGVVVSFFTVFYSLFWKKTFIAKYWDGDIANTLFTVIICIINIAFALAFIFGIISISATIGLTLFDFVGFFV
jgi:hypothetical protein